MDWWWNDACMHFWRSCFGSESLPSSGFGFLSFTRRWLSLVELHAPMHLRASKYTLSWSGIVWLWFCAVFYYSQSFTDNHFISLSFFPFVRHSPFTGNEWCHTNGIEGRNGNRSLVSVFISLVLLFTACFVLRKVSESCDSFVTFSLWICLLVSSLLLTSAYLFMHSGEIFFLSLAILFFFFFWRHMNMQ